VKWEGPDAAEEHVDNDERGKTRPSETVRLATPPPAIPPSETEDESDSEDEYIVSPEKFKGKGSSSTKVRSYMLLLSNA